VVPGSYSSLGEVDANHNLFTSQWNIMSSATGRPSGGLLVETYDYYQINFWPAAILAFFPSAAAGVYEWSIRKRANRRSGRCPACGYDLRATPERCPECGTAVGDEEDGG
jgi:hypothetical protein